MTMAACIRCGEIKYGAFMECPECGQAPKSDEELAISMAYTDHFFDEIGLKHISALTKKTGKPPMLNEASMAFLMASLHKGDGKVIETSDYSEEDLP